MKTFLVLAHPEPRSFNGALFETAKAVLGSAGHVLRTSDLYRMAFHPVSDRSNFTTVKNPDYFKPQVEEMHATEAGGFAPDLEEEMRKVEWCDLMIWQFPLWWFTVPAILKGWVDRVFAMGRVYGYGRIYDKGAFRGKRAMLSVTTGGPRESYLKDGFNGDMEAILRPIHRGMLQFTGFDVLAPAVFYAPAHVGPEVREAWLAEFASRLEGIGREAPIRVGSY